METARLYHITANWSENDKTYERNFLICAENSKTAGIIAHNRVPIKLTKNERPHPEDKVRLRIRDLGMPRPRRTYFADTIHVTSKPDPTKPSMLEDWATQFALLWGFEIGKRANTEETPKESLRIMLEYENKSVLFFQWASEFLESGEGDHETFFQRRLRELLGEPESTSEPSKTDLKTDINSQENGY